MSIYNTRKLVYTYLLILTECLLIIPFNSDFLLYRLSFHKRRYWYIEYIVISAIGCLCSYLIFTALNLDIIKLLSRSMQFFFNIDFKENVINILNYFKKHKALSIILKPILPILPFGLVNMISANLRIPIAEFMFFSLISRILKIALLKFQSYLFKIRIIDRCIQTIIHIAITNVFFKILS